MEDFNQSLGADSQVKRLLADQKAVRQLLNNPETRKLLQSLQRKNTQRLQEAAKSALQGDPSALNGVLQELAKDPQAAKAMEGLDQALGREKTKG